MNWVFGTTALDSFGPVTELETYLDMPERRGDNILIPYKPGRVHTTKYFDQRILSFGIFIQGKTIGILEDNFDDLKKAFGAGTQQYLTGYFNNGSVRRALAEVVNDLSVSRPFPKVAKIVVDFLLSEPYLRSTTQETNNVVINADPTATTITNPGTVAEVKPTIVLTGPLENTVITNSTNSVSLTYTGTIASPRIVTISINSYGEWVASDDLSANKIGLITHSGDPSLFRLDPGDNVLSIADNTATTGTVDINYYPPFL